MLLCCSSGPGGQACVLRRHDRLRNIDHLNGTLGKSEASGQRSRKSSRRGEKSGCAALRLLHSDDLSRISQKGRAEANGRRVGIAEPSR